MKLFCVARSTNSRGTIDIADSIIVEAVLSPLKSAPPLRTLHRRYPVEFLTEALAEGIMTGHPAMPQFKLELDQIGDLIAYLKSLE